MVEHNAIDANKLPPGAPSFISARDDSVQTQARQRRRLVFYDDSAVFGGHEVMSLLGLEAVLAEGGRALFEIGAAQGADVTQIFRAAGFASIAIRCDLDCRDRVIEIART